jgi:hypothetical protein
MSYETINHSVIYYELNGYKYVYAPWLVSEETSNVNDKVLVASGEQSFLEMIKKNQVEPKTRFFTVTPCFRDEIEDDTHKTCFMKTELFYFEYLEYNNNMEQLKRFRKEVDHSVVLCKKFYDKYLETNVINIKDQNDSLYLFDIESKKTEQHNPVELGSYGIRIQDNQSNTSESKPASIMWCFGTGCAEPRLSYTVNKLTKPGYHLSLIPKTKELGGVEKIVEEYEEFIDAVKQKSDVMALVELSDLIGAIELYLNKNHNKTIKDLLTFNDITKRVFNNGRRQ